MSRPESPAEAWVRSGAAALTGWPDGPGLVPPDALLDRIRQLGDAAGVDPFAALTERAATAGLSRQGRVSCGGSTRLLPTTDGWVAVTLAREDDLAGVPAWLLLDDDPGPDPWSTVTDVVRHRPGHELVDRAVLLGLPVAALPVGLTYPSVASPTPRADTDGLPPVQWVALGPTDRASGAGGPLVVDLSSLWAGPLCSRRLAAAGAEVIKVESVDRPDGARRAAGSFFDRLHAEHRSVAVDFRTDAGRGTLRRLIAAADVVIEASRPRALDQLGLGPDEIRPDGPRVWVSITGYGRSGPGADRVAFGDDAAAGAGLVAPTADGPVFVADAVADPLTGLAAAAAVLDALDRGGRWLLDVPMADVANWVAAAGQHHPWRPVEAPPAPPALPPPRLSAPALGADTDTVLAGIDAS